MREIKFRSWAVKEKRFVRHNVHIDGDGCMSWAFGYECHPVMRDEYIIEQFTGLLDSNRKEIYEGDIIKIPEIIPVVVSFRYGMFVQDTVGPTCSLIGFITEHSAFGSPVIIGNIHENPELLEVKS